MILKVVVVNYFIHRWKTVRIPPAVISKPFPLLLHFMQLNSANFELTNVLRVVGTCCRLKIKYSPICKPSKPRSQTTSTTLAGPRPNHLHNAPQAQVACKVQSSGIVGLSQFSGCPPPNGAVSGAFKWSGIQDSHVCWPHSIQFN